jgi:hypothetical protein
VLALLVGCASSHDVESQVTIATGVYGQALDGNGKPLANLTIEALGPLGQSDQLQSATTNRDGVYQLGVTGSFFLCAPSSCTTTLVAVPTTGLARYDWTATADGGTWWHYSTTP